MHYLVLAEFAKNEPTLWGRVIAFIFCLWLLKFMYGFMRAMWDGANDIANYRGRDE